MSLAVIDGNIFSGSYDGVINVTKLDCFISDNILYIIYQRPNLLFRN